MLNNLLYNIHNSSSFTKGVLASLSLLLSFLYFFYFIHFGIDLYDTFFHINYFIHKILDPTTFLSSIFGHYIGQFFGSDLINFRIFYICIIFLMQLLPIVLIEKPKRIYFLISFFPISLIFAPTMANYLSYDAFTILFTTFFICWLILFIKKKKSSYLFFLSFLSAVLIGLRLPNFVVLFFTSIILVIIYRKNFLKSFQIVLYYISGSLLFYGAIVLLFFDSFDYFFSELNYFLSVKGKSHSFYNLLVLYIYEAVKILIFLFVFSIFLLNNFLDKVFTKYKNYIVYLIFALIYFLIVFEKSHSYRLGSFLFAFVIYVLLTQFKKQLFDGKFIYLVLLLFAFIPALGSDTGLHKTSFIFVFLPYLLSTGFQINKNIICIIIVLIPFSIVQRFGITYYDVAPTKANTYSSITKISNIKSSKERIKYIEEIKTDYTKYSKNHEVIFYGMRTHIFNYLFLNHKPYFLGFFQKFENDNDLIRLNSMLGTKQNLVLIVFNKPNQIIETDFHKNILKLGYRFKTKSEYIVYLR